MLSVLMFFVVYVVVVIVSVYEYIGVITADVVFLFVRLSMLLFVFIAAVLSRCSCWC